jgi:hypothetical protein
METQSNDTTRDAGVYVLIYSVENGSLNYETIASKKDVITRLEMLQQHGYRLQKLFKGAKETEVRTKVTFTF